MKKIVVYFVFVLILGIFKLAQVVAVNQTVTLSSQTMSCILGGGCVSRCKGYDICLDANPCADHNGDKEACNSAVETDGTGITAWACTGEKTTACTPSNPQVCKSYKHCEWRGLGECGASAVYFDNTITDSDCNPK